MNRALRSKKVLLTFGVLLSKRPALSKRVIPTSGSRFFKGSLLVIGTYLLLAGFSGCDPDQPVYQIPQVYVEETINLDNFEYNDLKMIGGYVYIEGGVRGIIVYRESTDRYVAFERNCPYQPLDDCARVKVDESTLFLIDTCCNSTFSWDGTPTGGPAELPLLEYPTYVHQNYLTITNDLR